jgi:hypothetical protein
MAEFVVSGHHSRHQVSGFLQIPKEHSSITKTRSLKKPKTTHQYKKRGSNPQSCMWSSTPTRALTASKISNQPPRPNQHLRQTQKNSGKTSTQSEDMWREFVPGKDRGCARPNGLTAMSSRL